MPITTCTLYGNMLRITKQKETVSSTKQNSSIYNKVYVLNKYEELGKQMNKQEDTRGANDNSPSMQWATKNITKLLPAE